MYCGAIKDNVAAEQNQPADFPMGAPDHPPVFEQVNGVLFLAVLLMLRQMRLERTFDV
jgi:hypothetical protein